MRVLYYRDCRTINKVRTPTNSHRSTPCCFIFLFTTLAVSSTRWSDGTTCPLPLNFAACDTHLLVCCIMTFCTVVTAQITLAKITAEGPLVSDPYSLDTKWDHALFVQPKAGADTGGSW